MGEFEIAPKKGYVSLRRKKQFAMLGPATNTRFEVGINHKTLKPNARLVAQPAGSMCQGSGNFVRDEFERPVRWAPQKAVFSSAECAHLTGLAHHHLLCYHYRCQFIVKLTDAKEVDSKLIGWIKQAYEAAG